MRRGPTACRRFGVVGVVVALCGLMLGGGCTGTQYYERERLQDPAMQFDTDAGFTFIRHKTEAAREGSFGGYGAAAAGGCACQ